MMAGTFHRQYQALDSTGDDSGDTCRAVPATWVLSAFYCGGLLPLEVSYV